MEITYTKNGEPRYRASLIINGKKVVSPRFKRKTDLNDWIARTRSNRYQMLALGDSHNYTSKITFEEYAKRWLDTWVRPSRAIRTTKNYESKLRNHLIPQLGNIQLQNISASDANTLIDTMRKRGSNPKGINDVVVLLKTIMNRARKEKYIADNRLEGVSLLRKELKESTYWTKSEVDQFLRATIHHYLYYMFFTAIYTGMRLAELCGLEWDRIDFQRRLITVTRTRDKFGTKESTKSGHKREIIMAPVLFDLLQSLRWQQLHPTHVFVGKDGNPVPYGHIYRDFSACIKKAGVTKIRFHDLRHTFASLFMQNGGDTFLLQRLLGHSKIEMTMRYAHFSASYMQSAVRFIDMGASYPFLTPEKSDDICDSSGAKIN